MEATRDDDQRAGDPPKGPYGEKPSRLKTIVLAVMAIAILVPSMLGFGAKFLEFLHTFRGEADGTLAVTPMLNYLLASLGFFCMLIWATVNGMFHDVERPKHRMLEIERELDKQKGLGNTWR